MNLHRVNPPIQPAQPYPESDQPTPPQTTAAPPPPITLKLASAIQVPDLEIIEKAKYTLTFYTFSQGYFYRMKPNLTENYDSKAILKIALHTNMAIPPPVISRMEISNIWQNEEILCDGITVEFSSKDPVKTIFKYVKNLSPGLKVSPHIPPLLCDKYDQLQAQAYQFRNGEIRHKTVIKYRGNDLVLHVKAPGSINWCPIFPIPPAPPGKQVQRSKPETGN